MPFSLCSLSTSAAMLAYPATISFDLMLSAGPMIGHLVARSVRTEREEKRGEEALDNEQVLHILAMLIGAGSETTSSILQSFFKIMALHPECVKRAHEGSSSNPISDVRPLIRRQRAGSCHWA